MISELHQISNEEERFLKLMDNEVARGNNTAIIHGHSRIKKYFYEAAESM